MPKAVDQSLTTTGGLLTQNGKFYKAAQKFKEGQELELIKVYEKIKKGIWVYNGVFELVDAWLERSLHEKRNVFKFKLQVTDKTTNQINNLIDEHKDLDHNRIIPTPVKLEVYKRDNGKCVQCGSSNNLHFDHIIPFTKGGTSIKAENIQLLCARHNLIKRDNNAE